MGVARPWPRIYGHRGASATHPENTLDAFAEALRLGVDGIELDVRPTRDGIPVVLHDASLHRIAGVDGLVSELSAGQLRDLVPRVPTLADVLALVDGRCHLDIEVKVAGVEEATLALLCSLPSEGWAISSFDWDVLRAVRRLSDDAELWVLCLSGSEAAFAAAEVLSATTLAIQQGAITAEVVERAHSVGKAVMAWTVNDRRRLGDLAAWGVDAVCTDDPAAMLTPTSAARPGPRRGRRGRRSGPGS